MLKPKNTKIGANTFLKIETDSYVPFAKYAKILIPSNAKIKKTINHVCQLTFAKKDEPLDVPLSSGRGVNVGNSSGVNSVIDLIYSCVLIIFKIHINFSRI